MCVNQIGDVKGTKFSGKFQPRNLRGFRFGLSSVNSVRLQKQYHPHTLKGVAMTNEEIQKTMKFILEQQAQFAANIQRLQEERLSDSPRLARLEESFQLLLALSARHRAD